MTDEEKRRKRKISNLARRLGISKEEAEKYLYDSARLLNGFSKETGGIINIIGLEDFK